MFWLHQQRNKLEMLGLRQRPRVCAADIVGHVWHDRVLQRVGGVKPDDRQSQHNCHVTKCESSSESRLLTQPPWIIEKPQAPD